MLPRLGNAYLSQSAYSIMSDIFALPIEDSSSNVADQVPDVLKVVLSSPPSKSDTVLPPAWAQVLGNAMSSYSAVNPEACAKEVGKVWKAVWNFLDSNDAITRKAISRSLDVLCRSFPLSLIAAAAIDKDGHDTLHKIITQVEKALDSLAYARSVPELLSIVSSLITQIRLQEGGSSSPSVAQTLLIPLVKQIGDMRIQKGFEYKEAVDTTLATAMRVFGPEVVLSVLPLNLEPENRYVKPFPIHPVCSRSCQASRKGATSFLASITLTTTSVPSWSLCQLLCPIK